ncbi:hypothetical protein A1OE_192 [Candidatus Endolissoclinum faulkneri L2]|uniref:HIT domain-containing protein n=1 Tax=Candidatus Endolissoclinum faulkneri L2 TaxID=1193729 RepID=K7YP90_9PROT|nr:HIT domain-containing protein [Candidatus Endolissoclinum faulkneri]AFX98394.1 hypothetical protein A1OE_192 [Candidatus Endolissoclinum faulkneri L2]
MLYDANNTFAKILRGDIPSNTIYEDDYTLAFKDINPCTPFHVLIIPKGDYVSLSDFSQKASNSEIIGFIRAVGNIIYKFNLAEKGYRIVANSGSDANQEVFHFHLHMLAGKNLGSIIKPI